MYLENKKESIIWDGGMLTSNLKQLGIKKNCAVYNT